MSTGIRIEAVKEVTDKGKVGFRILSVAALTQDKLPELYLNADEKPIVYLDNAMDLNLRNRNEGTHFVCPNSLYTTIEMEKRLAHIREAGQHLTDVNAHLAKEREAWHGKVTFVDGVEQEQKKDIPSKKHSAEQLYKITDGSWNLCSTNTGMEHISGLKFVHGKYRIINRGCDLPAYQGCALTPKRNDTIIQNIDTGQIVFTYARFLCQA